MGDIEQQLRRAALDSGLSMLQLSKRSGIPYSAIHGFMKSGQGITLRTASKLAALLNLTLQPVRNRGRQPAKSKNKGA